MATEGIKKRVTGAAQVGWALTREAGAAFLAYELYPLGVPGYPIPVLAPGAFTRRAGGSGEIPILFIHGIFHNPSAFTWLKHRLALRGFRRFHEINLFTTFNPVAAMARQTAECVTWLRQRFGVDQVDVVAHSLGGLVARYYVQLLGGDGVVRHLVTLGTPHQGTLWSRLAPLPHVRELRPGSPLFRKLAAEPPPRRTQAVAVAGELDFLMRPRGCEFWEGVRNIRLRAVGHAGLLFSSRVGEIIHAHLRPGDPRALSLEAIPRDSPDVAPGNVR